MCYPLGNVGMMYNVTSLFHQCLEYFQIRLCIRCLRTLPHNNRQVAAEIQIQNILCFIRNFEAEAFANDHMPIGAEFFIHRFFD